MSNYTQLSSIGNTSTFDKVLTDITGQYIVVFSSATADFQYSNDYGQTWNSPNFTEGSVNSVAVRADNATLFVVTTSGYLWSTPLQTINWTQASNFQFQAPNAVFVSNGGTYIYVWSFMGFFLSTNSGSSFTQYAGSLMYANQQAYSLDGSRIIITNNSELIAISSDYGQTFTEVNISQTTILPWSGSGLPILSLSSSNDGMTIVVTFDDLGNGYTHHAYSVDGGSTWAELQQPEGSYAAAALPSADGSMIYVMSLYMSLLYYSSDFTQGTNSTWQSYATSGPASLQTVFISRSGNAIFYRDNSNSYYYMLTVATNNNPVACYSPNTLIFCYDSELEKECYISLKDIDAQRHLVKTYRHGYRPVNKIVFGKFRNDPSSDSRCMYTLPRKNYPGLIADLDITGLHSIFVDPDHAAIATDMESEVVDGKVAVMARFTPSLFQEKSLRPGEEEVQYAHIVLESPSKEQRYLIWVNGVLSESVSNLAWKLVTQM